MFLSCQGVNFKIISCFCVLRCWELSLGLCTSQSSTFHWACPHLIERYFEIKLIVNTIDFCYRIAPKLSHLTICTYILFMVCGHGMTWHDTTNIDFWVMLHVWSQVGWFGFMSQAHFFLGCRRRAGEYVESYKPLGASARQAHCHLYLCLWSKQVLVNPGNGFTEVHRDYRKQKAHVMGRNTSSSVSIHLFCHIADQAQGFEHVAHTVCELFHPIIFP